MICTNCGTQFEDGAFCPNCGASAAPAPTAVPVAPAPTGVPVAPVAPAPQPQYNYAPDPSASYYGAAAGNPQEEKSCLTNGILAAALSCTFFASFLGIVFGVIGLNKAKAYLSTYNIYPAKVRVGKYLSIGGIAFGAFMTIYFVIYLFAIIAAAIGMR